MTQVSINYFPMVMASMLLASCSSDDNANMAGSTDFLGDTVTVANTFEDATITGGLEAIYGLSDPTAVSDPEVELPNFINFYNMDFSANTLTMTLVNNSDAADLVLPDARYDRYYIGFASNSVASATLDGSAELNEFANVTVLPAEYSLEATDAFSTGITLPVDFAQGGLRVELGGGTDLTNTGVKVKVTFD